jgi:hypothetical protein
VFDFDRLAILVAALRFPGMGDASSRYLRYESYARIHDGVRSTSPPYRHSWGAVRRVLMQHLSVVFHSTLDSCLRDASHLLKVVLMLLHAFLLRGYIIKAHIVFFPLPLLVVSTDVL